VLCDNIGDYCAEINNNNQQQNFPGCNGFVLNNDEWFAFVAGTTSITIEVVPSNCTSNGNNQGMQGGIYRACVSQAVDLQCQCTENPFILQSNSFVVGQTYYFVADGCGGDVCDYDINVLSGSTVPPPPANPAPIMGPDTVCVGTTANYTTSAVSGATIYNWTLTPSGIGTLPTGTGTSKNVTWGNTPGTATLCVSTANACITNPVQECIEVVVIPKPTADISGSGVLCQGTPGTVTLTVNFTGAGPWTFVYRRNGANQAPITTTENPYTFTVNQPGTYTLFSVNTSAATNCAGTVSGSATVTEIILTPNISTTPANCGLSNGSVNFGVSGGTAPYTYSWSNGATTEDLADVPGGPYTVTVTDANGCTKTASATVANNTINFSVSGTTTASTICLPPGNGSINITVNPGPASNYTFNWDPGGITTEDLANIPAGSYTVTVSAGGTCTQVQTFTIADQPNQPNLSSTQVNTTCELDNGSINLTVSGGVPAYTYAWDPGGQITEDLSNLLAGTYTVTVTGANGCTRTAQITVTNNNPPFNITPTIVANTRCDGTGNGSISLSVSPSNSYTFIWDGGQTTSSITNQLPGTYAVTVSAGGACTQVQNYTIPDQPNQPNLSATQINTTCELSNGSINLSVSGGVAPYTFTWDPDGQITEDLASIPAGTYTVTVTGANGCTRTTQVTVSNNNPTFNINANIQPSTTCNGNGNGSISLSVTPNGSYTFIWDGGQTTSSLSNLLPGSYQVTVSAGGACTQVQSFTVPEQPNQPNLSSTQINTTCDLSNGSINLSVSGGVAPYTYLWDPLGQMTQDIGSIPAGTYTVTVTGANGCTRTAEVTISNNNPTININATIQASTTCNGMGNGSIALSVTPSGSYTFLWDYNSLTTSSIINVPAGTYNVTVSGGGSCTQEQSFTVPDVPNLPNLSATTISSTCELSNGSINLTVSGGVPPYTYIWAPGGQVTQDLNNIPEGTYDVTVTGANGCTAETSVTVGNNNPTFNINPTNIQPSTTCNATGNGSIAINVTPPGSYTYIWAPGGQTGTSITGLQPGTYTVTVNGGGACIQFQEFEVPNIPNEPNLLFNSIDARCGLNNGSIDLSVSGGAGPFSYTWSPGGQTVQDPNNVPTGSYEVTVTGSNGCTAAGSVDVGDEFVPIAVNENITANTSCLPPGNGRITITTTPPNATVVWSNASTAKTLVNLPPGDYTVTVTAMPGGTCIETFTYTIPDESEVPEIFPENTDANCGLSNGAIQLDVVNGALPYKFKWNNGLTTQDLNNLPAGTYSVTVTTAQGCTAATTVVINDIDLNINIYGIVEPNTSCTSPDGYIYIDTDPSPTAIMKFKWSNNATTRDLLNLSAGTYTITVTLGTCTASEPFDIQNAATPPNLSASGTPTTCGQNNGSVTATPSGGISPYKYKWSANAGGSTAQSVNNLVAGTYTVTVTGGNGCTATATVVVPNNNLQVTLSASLTDNTSCVAGNGAIDLTAAPAGTYKYLWSNMATTEDIANLTAGTYTVTATLGVSCTSTAVYTVVQNTSDPVISPQITASICGASNGAIDLSVTGGTTPYTFAWSNTATTEDLSGVLADNYTVTVTAANGCTAVTTLNVPNNSNTFTLSGAATSLTNCAAANGTVGITVTSLLNPPGTFSFEWSNTAITEDLSGLSAGTYTVTVSETGSACTASASYIVADERLYPSASQTLQPEICGLSNGSIDASATGGITPYTYLWSSPSGITTQDLSNISAGIYTLTVTGANGCTATTSAEVPDNAITFSVSGITVANTACAPNNGGIDLSVTPAGTYTFEWNSGPKTEDLSVIPGGNYTVTVSAGGTCTSIGTFVVTDNTLAPILSEKIEAASCAKTNGSIDLSVSGSLAPFTFEWNNGPKTEDQANIPSGTYTVTVTGANGCVTIDDVTVAENVIAPSIGSTPVPNTTCGSNSGSITLSVTPPTGPYTYKWSSGQTTANISGLAPGQYTVTVDGGGACVSVATIEVLNATNAPVLSGTLAPSPCAKPEGSITLGVSGSTPPYTYKWSNGPTTKDIAGLVPGTYTVTATGADGCVSTASYTVDEQVTLPQIDGSTAPNTACATPTGTVTVNVTPFGTYTYAWSNGPTTQNLSSLPAGSYTVTVNGGGNCISTATFEVLSQTDSPQITPDIKPSLCAQPDGGIDLNIVGGTLPYGFKWSSGQTTEDLSGILSGTYTVTVSASNGCTATASIDVPNNSNSFSIAGALTANTACGYGNGAVNVTMTPTDAYTFKWSSGQTTEDLSALTPGTYTVTATDPGKCAASATFVILEEAKPVAASGTKEDILCFGEKTGSIDLEVSVGVQPFTYKWNPTQPGDPQDLNAIGAGTYRVTVTDAVGCTGTASFNILQPAAALALTCGMTKVVTQPGGTDGEAEVNITGGTAPFTVTLSPGGAPQTGVAAGKSTFPNLSVGQYSVAVTDANGCSAECNFSVGLEKCETVVGSMSAAQLTRCGQGCITATYSNIGQYLQPNDVLQFILHTGSSNIIVGEVARSTQPTFCFDPAKMTYGTTYHISAVAGNNDGSGNVVLADYCTVVSFGTPVIFNEKPEASIVPPLPIHCERLQSDLVGSSTIATSVFDWKTANGQVVGATNQPIARAGKAGLYTLIVTANTCADTVAAVVQDITNKPQAVVSASPDDVLDCKIDEIVLSGVIEGTINANTIWMSNGQFYSSENPVKIETPGTYEFVILDTLTRCTDTALIIINENLAFPTLFIDPAKPITCKSPSVTLTGGSPFGGIQFRWGKVVGNDTTLLGSGTSLLVNTPGTYVFIGIDPSNQCKNSAPVVVVADIEHPVAEAGVGFTVECFGEIATLDGSASTGQPGFTFQWSTQDGQLVANLNTATPTISEPGTYALLITNVGNGCTDADSVVIAPEVPVPVLDIVQPRCFGDKGRFAIKGVQGGKPPFRYSLDEGQTFTTQSNFTGLTPGSTYNIYIIDSEGCEATTSVTLNEPTFFDIKVEPEIVQVALGDTYTIVPKLSVPTTALGSIRWLPGKDLDCDTCLTPTFKAINTTYFKVMAEDTAGCPDEALFRIYVDKEPHVYIPNVFTPNKDGDNKTFMIFGDEKQVVKIRSFQIFSRWGEMVFEQYDFAPNNPTSGWDGRHRGTDLNPAVFAWYAEIEFLDGNVVLYKGDVTLVR